ncbi:hypothetical protein Y1Q_0006270 [Alligator mississippiensis]|uniref:MROH2B-like N-terminal HEAT-repeats domain-containing protein n=1 Tax=Alligator mississippiensis TaxID=8496 RepID=A0A151NXE8_ALLMI|nr:hypothetical protein Y1Q_0006270 [Alligator mississippiensis]
MKQALCGVVGGFARAANMKFQIMDESPFPSCQAANYCFHVLPFFNLMSSSWLSSKDPESLSQSLEVAYDFQVPLPDGKLNSICFSLHTQPVSPQTNLFPLWTPGSRLTRKQAMWCLSQSLVASLLLTKSKNHSILDAEEEQSIRATCVEILENLDVSISGISQEILRPPKTMCGGNTCC